MRITHNARPWEPACIRSHAGFVCTTDRDQPSVTPQTATKGFSSLTCRRSFRQSTVFPALPRVDLSTKRSTTSCLMTIGYSILGFYSEEWYETKERVRAAEECRWYRRGDANVLVDDPIVSKSENLFGFSLRSEEITPLLLAWNNCYRENKRVLLVWGRVTTLL